MTQEQERNLIIKHSVRAYEIEKYGALLVENKYGVVLSIFPHLYGYEITCPIVPNRKTGSAIGITGDYWDYATIEQTIVYIDTMEKCPISSSVYSHEDMKTIVLETLDSAVNRHENILGWVMVK